MRPQPSYLNPSITEAWLRKYQVQEHVGRIRQTYDVQQVLPGRTHPLMMMSGGGGYLLHSTYVYVAYPFQKGDTMLISYKVR